MNDDEQVRWHHHPHRKPARTSHGNAKAGKTGGAGGAVGRTARSRTKAKAKNAKAGTAGGGGGAPVRPKAHQHAAHVSTTTNPLVK